MPDTIKLLLIIIAVFLLVAALYSFARFWDYFSSELDYINNEIRRSSGEKKKHWKRAKRKLFLSLIPFYNRFFR